MSSHASCKGLFISPLNKLLVDTDDKAKCLSSSYQVGSGSAAQSIAGESDDFLDVPSAKALQNRITKVHIYFSGQIQQYFFFFIEII